MAGFVIFFLILIVLMVLPVSVILAIAYFTAQSRKKKQQQLLSEVPENDFHVFVRYNKGKQQDKILKVVGFQGSGVLYVKDNQLYFMDTLHQNPHTFDLKNSEVKWENVNIINGALRWFSVHDGTESYYFNIESGMFIWHTDSRKLKTKDVYEKVLEFQKAAQ